MLIFFNHLNMLEVGVVDLSFQPEPYIARAHAFSLSCKQQSITMYSEES
jgi:hypothetical protein